MPQFDRFLIAPIKDGVRKDLQPWLIPDNAFAELRNMYLFRGRLRKRFGSTYMQGDPAPDPEVAQLQSRLRVQVGTIAAPVSPVPGVEFNIGQLFSAGDQIFTVITAGVAQPMLATGVGTGTFSTTNGAFALAGTGLAGATPIYWYPALPVMGLINYENGVHINDEPIFAFDTQFAYQFTSTGWERLSTEAAAGDATWTGSNSDFFWGTTYRGSAPGNKYLFVTNFNGAEPNYMRYWDGTQWNSFRPAFGPGVNDFVDSARLIIPFKNRLILANTIENGTNYNNSIRWCQIGDPITATSPTAFFENPPDPAVYGPLAGYGGQLTNLETSESIIAVEYLKDRLIFGYERSTWELVYTGNQVLPFMWQKLNTELGTESTFSMVPFDKVVLSVGNVGITACTGATVDRIDDKIPDTVFEFHNVDEGSNQESMARIQGIRDYFVEMVYWTFPNDEGDVYPNSVLVYNYKTGSWAFNDDSITCFGYYFQISNLTWGNTITLWQNMGQQWTSGQLQSHFRQVIGGNQEGYVFLIDPDSFRNAGVLQITNLDYSTGLFVFTVIDHNLTNGDYVLIENLNGVTATGLNNEIFQIETINSNSFFIYADFSEINPSGAYTGGGTMARVSKIDVLSKQYNPYNDKGKDVFIQKVDVNVDRVGVADVEVPTTVRINYYASSSVDNLTNLSDPNFTNQLLGTGNLQTSPYALYPAEQAQERYWHVFYLQGDGECIQFQFTYNDAQMKNKEVSLSDFQINGMVLYTMPVTRLL